MGFDISYTFSSKLGYGEIQLWKWTKVRLGRREPFDRKQWLPVANGSPDSYRMSHVGNGLPGWTVSGSGFLPEMV